MKKLKCVLGQLEGLECQNYKHGDCELDSMSAYMLKRTVISSSGHLKWQLENSPEPQAVCNNRRPRVLRCALCGASVTGIRLCDRCHSLIYNNPSNSRETELRELLIRARKNTP